MNQHPELPKSLDTLFKGELMPHQVTGVSYLLKKEEINQEEIKIQNIRGAILSDEPGLGKTIQIIATIVASPFKGTSLIITPANVLLQFEKEILKYAPHLNVVVLYGKRKKKSLTYLSNNFPDTDIILTSYGVISSGSNSDSDLYNQIIQHQFTRIVLDEGHCIRNKNKLHKCLINLKSDIKFILTGTPIHNSVSDGRNILKMLGITEFIRKKNIKLYFDKYMLRRTKDVLTIKLNKPDIHIVPVIMKGSERDLYTHQHEGTVEQMNMFNFIENINDKYCVMKKLIRLRLASIQPQLLENHYNKMYKKDSSTSMIHEQSKFDTLIDMIHTHPQDSSIIFCHFTKEIDTISEQLRKQDLSVEVYDGRCDKTSVLKRCHKDYYKKYIQMISCTKKEKGLFLPVDIQMKINDLIKGDVLIIQINAGSVGLNLQKFNRIYFTSPHYNPAIEEQAIGRCYRIGQKKKVYVTKLISVLPEEDDKKTFEEIIIQRQLKKRKIQSQMLKEDNN